MPVQHYITVRTQFTGFHRYVDAPEDVKFLRNWHRHVFHVAVKLAVADANRKLEFFQVKRMLDNYLALRYVDQCFEQSCEQIAGQILEDYRKHGAVEVEVSEDGENSGWAVIAPGQQIEDVDDEKYDGLEEAPQDVPVTKAVGGKTPPTMQVKPYIFFGVEVEGPRQGWGTLFVPHLTDVGTADIVDAYNKIHSTHKVFHIYYGAGNLTAAKSKTLDRLVFERPELFGYLIPLTVECEKYEDLGPTFASMNATTMKEKQGIIVVSRQSFDLNVKQVAYVKQIVMAVQWTNGVDEPIYTPLDHAQYANDVKV